MRAIFVGHGPAFAPGLVAAGADHHDDDDGSRVVPTSPPGAPTLRARHARRQEAAAADLEARDAPEDKDGAGRKGSEDVDDDDGGDDDDHHDQDHEVQAGGGRVVPSFANVNIYALAARVLGLGSARIAVNNGSAAWLRKFGARHLRPDVAQRPPDGGLWSLEAHG